MTAANVTNLPMSQPLADPSEIMERVLLLGDLTNLTAEERTSYYMQTCRSLGLNPLTRPFDYIRLSGREVLYAKRDCADQLRKINKISLEIVDRKMSGDLLVITVRATTPDGRSDEDMGVVSVKGLGPVDLSNAMLRAMTKAKRRVTLSICGLGMLDETEVRSVLDAEALAGPVSPDAAPRRVSSPLPPAEEVKAKPAKPPLVVYCHDGSVAEFPRTGAGLQEAMKLINDSIEGHHPEVVGMNYKLLDGLVKAYPAMADDIAEMRAAAVMAADGVAPDPDPDPDPGEDDFPGDMPSSGGEG